MSKIPNGQEIIHLLEQFAPKHLAMEGDPIGLQIGSLNKPIQRVMVTLDVLEEVVDEAIKKHVDLIIAHHPPLYRPLKQIITDHAQGRIVEKCLKHDIAIYAAHTNLDIAIGGVNDWLSEALGLQEIDVLVPTYEESLKKLVVYVPDTHAHAVREAIGNAGAGHIGNYSHCTFNSRGIGTFLPEEGANPFIGEKGTLEEVEEVRIETIFPAALQKKVVAAMLKAHPYEEVAYDVYPLENKGRTWGLGRIGYLPEEMTLRAFAEHVKKALDVQAVRVVGDLQDKVKRVAVIGGDGNKYIRHAKMSGADVYVTGDVYYHVAHDAMALGLHIVDPGHYAEKVMKQGLVRFLEQQIGEKWDVSIFASAVHTDPFTFV
ncbi:Nif3-like dinuclear metal center hexameric protein [Anoxybacteroides amylolyticum]|uniref:GTP cyclohydrolase 1 type 2 homolog n=1 Tax=Anoxybacteroides amylolyticum TaxID=294699 RepID=A0A160F5S3_9BACL|nr:Nif3-like dinuclear metal center hexameric protein [Anoxybacillus amylolyticus]ANB61225.1 NIF3-related protein [Anoxybacillus amylolyticus]